MAAFWWILAAIVVIGSVLLVRYLLLQRARRPAPLNLSCQLANGTYQVQGTKDAFIIRKDDRFEFLVRDGVIVAAKDSQRSPDFQYYEVPQR